MATFYQANVTATNGSAFVEVNSSTDDIGILRERSFLQIGTNRIVEVKRGIAGTPDQIELAEAWDFTTTTDDAIAGPTAGDLAEAVAAIRNLNQQASDILENSLSREGDAFTDEIPVFGSDDTKLKSSDRKLSDLVIRLDNITSLSSLNTAALVDGQQFHLSEFWSGTGVGGGHIKWNASRSKTEHNGINVIDPARIGSIISFGDFNGYFIAASSGTGVFEREEKARYTLTDAGMAPGVDLNLPLKALMDASLPIDFNGGSYNYNESIATTQDVDIYCSSPISITCTAGSIIDSFIKSDGVVVAKGSRVTLDAAELCYLGLHTPEYLPTVENWLVQNTPSVAFLPGRDFDGSGGTNNYSGSKAKGKGYLKYCRIENCGSLTIPAGDSGEKATTSFGLIECETDELSGSITNIYNLANLGVGYVYGGHYKGVKDPNAGQPNMTRTDTCIVMGGIYEGLYRGPTIGEESTNVVFIGGQSIDCEWGVSLDARITATEEVPHAGGVVDWTCIRCNRDIFCQAGGVYIKQITSVDATDDPANDSFLRLTDAKDVVIGDINLINPPAGKIGIILGEADDPIPGSKAIMVGKVTVSPSSTALNSNPIRVSGSSELRYGSERVISSSEETLSLIDETVLIDASGGSIVIRLPNDSSVASNIIGKVWVIKVVDSTNSVAIQRAGGSSTLINGGTGNFSIPSGSGYREVTIEAIGGGDYIVTQSL